MKENYNEKYLPPSGELYIKGFDACVETIKDYMKCRNISSIEMENYIEDKRKSEIRKILDGISKEEKDIIKKIRDEIRKA